MDGKERELWGDGIAEGPDRPLTVGESACLIAAGLGISSAAVAGAFAAGNDMGPANREAEGKAEEEGEAEDGRQAEAKNGGQAGSGERAENKEGAALPQIAESDVPPPPVGEATSPPPMSREAFTYMLVRALESAGDYPMVKMFIVIGDEAAISPPCQGAVQRALLYRLTRLDENAKFHPQAAITAGEAAEMIRKACELAVWHDRGGGKNLRPGGGGL